MKNRSTQIMAFAFFLNFNRPASDYSELVHKLAERGFVRRFPRVGYLVAKGEPFVQNRESLEDKARLIESDPEKVSAIGKYSLVATVPLDSGKGIVISHHSDTPKFPSNSSDILEEVTYVINILKDKIDSENLAPCKLFIMTSVKTERRPYQVLASFDIKRLPLFTKMISDVEVAMSDNEIYLYSASTERTGGPGPIIEDMKLKGLPRQKDDKKRGWDQIIFKPRPGEYLVSMEYKTDNVDDMINVFKENENLITSMINELENLMNS